MRLGSGVAVAVAVVQAGSYSSNSIPSLGTFISSYAMGWGPKNTKKKTKKKTHGDYIYSPHAQWVVEQSSEDKKE